MKLQQNQNILTMNPRSTNPAPLFYINYIF